MMTDRAGAKRRIRICLPETVSLLRNYLCWHWAAHQCQYVSSVLLLFFPLLQKANDAETETAKKKKKKRKIHLSLVIISSSRENHDFCPHNLSLRFSRQATSLAYKIINVYTDKQSGTHYIELW